MTAFPLLASCFYLVLSRAKVKKNNQIWADLIKALEHAQFWIESRKAKTKVIKTTDDSQ